MKSPTHSAESGWNKKRIMDPNGSKNSLSIMLHVLSRVLKELEEEQSCVLEFGAISLVGWKWRIKWRRRSFHAGPYGMNGRSHEKPILKDK